MEVQLRLDLQKMNLNKSRAIPLLTGRAENPIGE
jgi:hypothetical protein